MKLEDTRITRAGVFRCCLATVVSGCPPGEAVEEGHESSCDHCGERFRLVRDPRKQFAGDWIWLPLWQIEGREGK